MTFIAGHLPFLVVTIFKNNLGPLGSGLVLDSSTLLIYVKTSFPERQKVYSFISLNSSHTQKEHQQRKDLL